MLRALFDRRRLIATTAVLLALAPPGVSFASKLRSRLPDPWNGNRHVVVVTDAPAPPVGTPFVRVEPGLAILGCVEGLEPGTAPLASDVRLRVSLYPEAEGLPRDDSQIDLRVTTPDLLEVVSKHFTPERRERLATKVEEWKRAHEQSIDRGLARLRVLVDEHVGTDELGRKLVADPLLQESLSRAFEHEVVDPIDWRAVVGKALGSDAAGSTGELLKHAGPLTSTWAGVRGVVRARSERYWGGAKQEGADLDEAARKTAKAIEEGDPDEAILEGTDLLGRALGSIGKTDTWRLIRDPQGWVLDNVLPDRRDVEAFKKAALERAGENLTKALPKHKDALKRDYLALGRDLSSETKAGDRALNFIKALGGDPALRDELVRRHGPEARVRLERFAQAASEDVELQTRAREVLTSGLELIAGTLRELALDDEGKGPNPMLVALVRARLLGRAEPVLVLVKTGTGLTVKEGTSFVSRRR